MDKKEKIIQLLKSKLSIKYENFNFSEDTKLRDDLEMDSMDFVEFLIGLESEFNISLTNEYLRIKNIETVGDAIEVINEIERREKI